MPLTVAQVVALPDLHLTVHTDERGLEREVRWVAVSEHLDPTPWLAPGDLLLTTGLAFDAHARGARGYVARLAEAGVAGLGVGTGPTRLPHRVVPRALVRAARDRGLPVFEVPEPVPFVALSKAVSRLLAAEEYSDAAAAFDTQRRLLRAIVAEGAHPAPEDVLRILARHVDGFALLVGLDAQVRSAYPSAAAARSVDCAAEIARIRSRGLRGSAALATVDETVSILPIGIHSPDGYLVVGSRRAMRATDQAVLQLAVSVLSWPVRERGVPAPWRELLVRHAKAVGLDHTVLAGLGLDRLDPCRAVVVVVRTERDGGSKAADRHRGPADLFLAPVPGGWEGFAPYLDGDLRNGLAALAAEPDVASVGVSSSTDLRDPVNVGQAFAQAERAAQGPGLVLFDDAPSSSVVDLADAARIRSWAKAYLGSLSESDEASDLMETVREWLASHGQVDAAAHSLGVHRHTVRHRLRRAEALLGRSLDDPQVRANLWFAIRAVDA